MNTNSATWNRHAYFRLGWKKRSGAHAQMLWRYEEWFHPGTGWASDLMNSDSPTGLIQSDIAP
jgi:hypothetical protein